MVNGMPVETVWMGKFSSSWETGTPSTPATTSCGCDGAELRLGLAHLAEEQSVALLEAHGNLADFEIEHDFVCAGLLAADTKPCPAWDVRRTAALR